MKTLELIKILQNLVDDHTDSGAEVMLGPHEIHMDIFQKFETMAKSAWQYRGVTGKLKISYTDDDVYCVLGPEEQWG